MTWQRATRPEQKEQRRNAILVAARELLDSEGLSGAGINAVARRAGISKANVYRYFESREAIFLHIVRDEFETWAAQAEEALAPLARSSDVVAVTRALISTLTSNRRLQGLIPAIASVLEQNVSVETIVWFKTELGVSLLRMSNALMAALPGLTAAGVRTAQVSLYFQLAGMLPAANPPPAVVEALKRPELAHNCIHLERELEAMMVPLLRGLTGAAATSV